MRKHAPWAAAVLLAGCAAPATRPAGSVPPPAPAATTTTASPMTVPPRLLAAVLADAPDLTRFRLLAAAGGLDRLVGGRASVTILAPTDAAFARLPVGTVEALMRPGNRPSLLHLLRFWIVTGQTEPAAAVGNASPVTWPTLDGEPISVSMTGGPVLADAAGRRGAVVRRLPTVNGMVVAIDGLIAPRSIEPGGVPRR
ncbi:MAG: fasciclin domain-containing protein [Janthinobacterium lividum]